MSRPVTPVAIVADTLHRLCAHLEESGDAGLPAALLADVRRAAAVAGGLDPYTSALSTPASPALVALAERTDAEDWDARGGTLEREMLSGHVEGQTLAMLVHATGARRVLEVGMFTGYSAVAMAEALPDDGMVVACELDEGVAAFAQECFTASPAGERIEVRVGPALETLHDLARDGHVFDLVFVDADKPGYADYLGALLDHGLLSARGLLVVDNTLMQGEPWLPGEPTRNGAAIASFNQVLADDERVEQVVLPVRDGVTLVRRVAR